MCSGRAPLTSGEWEQVRLHPYHSERILSCSTALEPIRAVSAISSPFTPFGAPLPPLGVLPQAQLHLLGEAEPNREIAQRLVISPRTAEHHVQHIYAKIGVSSRASAALFAMEHGLLA